MARTYDATSGTTEPCPDCRRRNGCKLDCGRKRCACRGVCEECSSSIDATVRRAACNGAALQGELTLEPTGVGGT